MEKIIPRWEWRTFANDLTKDFADIEPLIRSHGEPFSRTSSEIYILSANSNDNTKIRDELMDIKTPIRLNKNGLEQWTVLMKAGFPIHINDLALVYKAFGLPLPYLEKDEYSYEEYLNFLISNEKALTLVEVVKQRHGFKIDEAVVEIAYVTFNGVKHATIAVEHANPELVLATVKKLGLTKFENINYIKAMKNQLGIKY